MMAKLVSALIGFFLLLIKGVLVLVAIGILVVLAGAITEKLIKMGWIEPAKPIPQEQLEGCARGWGTVFLVGWILFGLFLMYLMFTP